MAFDWTGDDLYGYLDPQMIERMRRRKLEGVEPYPMPRFGDGVTPMPTRPMLPMLPQPPRMTPIQPGGGDQGPRYGVSPPSPTPQPKVPRATPYPIQPGGDQGARYGVSPPPASSASSRARKPAVRRPYGVAQRPMVPPR